VATSVQDDVIQALTEDIQGRIESISAVKKTGLAIYDPEQILTLQQKISTPAVLYHYAGMQGTDKKHDVVFFIYLITKAQNATATSKSSKAIAQSTAVLQELRQAMGCSKSVTNSKWVLQSEIPESPEGDKLIYRQRWATNYHISN